MVQGLGIGIRDVAPPHSLIHDQELSTCADLQKALLDTPHHNTVMSQVTLISSMTKAWAAAVDAGVVLPKVPYQEAMCAKAHGTLCVGVEYAMRKIIRETPATTEELPEHARKIEQKLREQRIDTPPYLRSLLRRMQATT